MNTNTMASTKVCTTCSMEISTKVEVSYGALQVTSPGKYCSNLAIRSFTSVAVAVALPLLDSITAIPTVGLPLSRVLAE